jgi:hypothetical protein
VGGTFSALVLDDQAICTVGSFDNSAGGAPLPSITTTTGVDDSYTNGDMLLVQKLVDIAQHLSSMCGEQSPPIDDRDPIPVRRLDLDDRDEIVDPVDEDIQTSTSVPFGRD